MKPLALDMMEGISDRCTLSSPLHEEGTFSLTAESEVKYSYFPEHLICLNQRSRALLQPLKSYICSEKKGKRYFCKSL